jgi:NADH-quinone oxidoreductase subunit C
MRSVAVTDWVAELAAARAAGFDCFDMLTGVDRGVTIEVIASVMRGSDSVCELVSTQLDPASTLPSLVEVYAGAAWYERELAEMFGVRITGAVDTRPLLRRTDQGAPTLLKSTVLGARVLTAWPGDSDSGDDAKANRRRQRAVGVADDWLVLQDIADE